MKIIIQYELDEFEKMFNNAIDKDKYIVDRDVYAHFLNNIYVEEFKEFVSKFDSKFKDDPLLFLPSSEALRRYSKKIS